MEVTGGQCQGSKGWVHTLRTPVEGWIHVMEDKVACIVKDVNGHQPSTSENVEVCQIQKNVATFELISPSDNRCPCQFAKA